MNFIFFRVDSLRFKTRILAILILAAILVVYSGLLFVSFRRTLYEELDDNLKIKAQKIQNAISSYLKILGTDEKSFRFSASRVVSQTGTHPHLNKIENLEDLWVGQINELNIKNDSVDFFDSKGQLLAHSGALSAELPSVLSQQIPSVLAGHAHFQDLVFEKANLRVILTPVTFNNGRRCGVIIATPRDRVIRILKERLAAESFSVILILVIASLMSKVFVKRVLRPVEQITQAAKNINYKDLSVRIKTDGIDVEMKDLVDSLNEMISRLEKSFNYITEFSAHVSHELKTPLAIIRAESELALRSQHPAEEYVKVIRDNLDEVNRMVKTIEDLLLLTKLDYQPQVFKFDPVDLVEFFKDIEEPVALLAGQKNIASYFHVTRKSMSIRADKGHLRRLFYNLVNNAIKFTPQLGRIDITVEREGRRAFVSVKDTGIGISKENLSRIFDKFFHAEEPNAGGTVGMGLGLSIAQSIAYIHGGNITAESKIGKGSTFTVELPIL